MAEVRFQGVRKTFGKVVAVNDVDLEVREGEFVVLLGPSGCGKTTLLRSLAGLEKVDGGSVFIGGRDATDLPPRRRRIAMVFQSYAVFPHMKVYDNVGFGLKMQNEKSSVIRERVQSAAELLHRAELKALLQQLDTTTIYVTHDQVEALSMGDRIAVMNAGQIVQVDSPLAVYDHPADMFVGGFIGTPPMNFLEAQIVENGGPPVAQLSGG